MGFRVRTDVAMPMRDGCRLYADIYQPEGDGPFPVLFQRLPYDKDQVRYKSSALNIFVALRRGYAVVSQDVRGRFKSEGTFEPFVNEGRDGYDSCSWLVQQSWCNGSIGMFGASYLGDVQWLAAAEQAPGLKAIAPQMTPGSAYGAWFYQGGSFQLGLNLLWACRLAIGSAKRSHAVGDGELETVAEAIGNLDSTLKRYWDTPLRDVGMQHELVPEYREWLAHPTRDKFWKQLEDVKSLDQVAIPVFSLGGFHDVFLESTISNHLNVLEESSEKVRKSSRLVVGPWAHGALSGEFPERSYGLRSGFDGSDLTGAQLDWFDDVLSMSPTSSTSVKRVSVFVQGENQWAHFAEWPPASVVPTKYYLDSNGRANTRAGDGRLATQSSALSNSDEFVYEPTEPVPTVGGRTFLPGLFIGANSGQRDQSRIEDREDVLCYTSDRLSADLVLAGSVKAKLHVCADVLDTDLTVKLVDVDKDGVPWNVADSILRLRYRSSFETPEMLEPHEVYEVSIDVGTVVYSFLQGHHLRVEVSASNFPRFDRNTNTGGDIASESISASKSARIVLHHSRNRASHISLPIIDVEQLDLTSSLR